MIENFRHRYSDSFEDTLNIGQIMSKGHLTNEETLYLRRIKEAWNFYEGYHWEGIDDLDSPQVTFNYCRAFINKFVAFEFGKGFSIKTCEELDSVPITKGDTEVEVSIDSNDNGFVEPVEVHDPKEEVKVHEKTQQDFLTQVWSDNDGNELLVEMGQTKSITGEAWVKTQFESPEDLNDPFEEYPKGRIRLSVVPTQYVFPQFNDHDKDKLESLLIMYPIRREEEIGMLFKRNRETTIMYKEFWTNDEIILYHEDSEIDRMENPYGFIPFVQIKNFPIAGRTRGVGDLDDIIPLNVELNTKQSDVSEVIDYHSAPITLVYGAKIGNLEKGANKVWGGLPKDAKVENLSLQGDLIASTNYIQTVKTAMCEIAGIPETVLGGAKAISNTSGVALQYMNLPLIERTRVKRQCSQKGIQQVNKMILFIGLAEGLIEKPEDISMKDFVFNEVELPDTLPKDELIELQRIREEMGLGLECRRGALERMGVENIPKKLEEIDKERLQYPEVYNPKAVQATWYTANYTEPANTPSTNAGGMMNSQTPKEQVRIETTGQNGGAE